MNRLKKAIEIENTLKENGEFSFNAISSAIKSLGFNNVPQYFEAKKAYLYSTWKPEIIRPSIKEIGTLCQNAVKNEECKIIIPQEDGLRVWEGDEKVDHALCEELGIQIENVGAGGGTIIGSEKDFSMMLIMPNEIRLAVEDILNKFVQIISRYNLNTTWSGNDIIIDDKKVCGTTYRILDNVSVFTCQVSFEDYSEYIEKICTKKSTKTPGFINPEILSKEQFEEDVLNWLINKA
jgi:hypothetical protein